ncbi:MAG: 3-methyl-2-oxobutanoate hydroxymethyltransferase [Fimbriimonas sp.]|nr:3-methyl-2-oxobutanoate hydroxymethyltransferase [Fimbriimonas sp.]
MADKITAPIVRAKRTKGEKIVCITAYDAVFGQIADEAGADVVLVGDSLGNVVLGYSSTIPVTLDEMASHAKATRCGVKRALLVVDLPFGTYQASVEQAVNSAATLAKIGAEAVKMEGEYLEQITAVVKSGIPVMGHLGMTPQSVNVFGGFRVQGRGESGQWLLDSARRLQDAGAFAIVLELIPADLAKRITDELEIPTIGIGAGVHCSGQVQVIHDVLGLNPKGMKHAKRYVNAYDMFVEALKQYSVDVRTQVFPGEENSF